MVLLPYESLHMNFGSFNARKFKAKYVNSDFHLFTCLHPIVQQFFIAPAKKEPILAGYMCEKMPVNQVCLLRYFSLKIL
jgi:hypothetical protein